MNAAVVLWTVLAVAAGAQEYRTGWWRGHRVTYKVINGLAVTEGDIILGPAGEVPNTEPGETEKGQASAAKESIAVISDRYLWPAGVVPYTIDSSLPDQDRVRRAIEHWNTNTPIRLVPRSGQLNYVRFAPKADICGSYVGMIGREQTISLGEDCDTGAIIHEIGHAVGLIHEHSRHDRDLYVRLNLANVDKRELPQFEQALKDGADSDTGYDYGSIMHYSATGFSRNGMPVFETIPAGIPISQREALSPADLDAVRRLYRQPIEGITIATFPFGLEIEVDGERFQAPRTFQWAPGTTHTVNVPGPQQSDPYRYVFGRWSDGGDQMHTITVGEERSVYTAYLIQQYRMPLGVTPVDTGRLVVTPASEDGWFPVGTALEIQAVPSDGYRFRQWTGFGAFGMHGLSPNPLRVVVRGPETRYTANFTRSPLTTITSEPAGLRVVVDGEATTTPRSFAWTAGSTHTIDLNDTEQKTGNDTARHTFLGWSDGGGQRHEVTAGEDQTIVARFKTEHLVTLEPAAGGTVELNPQNVDGFYEAGTVLAPDARPQGGYKFTGWTGDGASSILVDDQKLVGANFGMPRFIAPDAVVNAASYLYGRGIAPQSIVTIFSPEIGAGGDVRVTFSDIEGTVIGAAADQVSVAVPASLTGRSAVTVRAFGRGWSTNPRILAVIGSDPAIFTYGAMGHGQAAALNADGSVNSAENPVSRGSIIVLWATGAAVSPVSVRIGGRDVRVLYAGQAPGMVEGVQQINAEIPADALAGNVSVKIRSGDTWSVGNISVAVR